jgi:hypothetical protein
VQSAEIADSIFGFELSGQDLAGHPEPTRVSSGPQPSSQL